jgi:integrase
MVHLNETGQAFRDDCGGPSPGTQKAYLRDVARLLEDSAVIGSRQTSYRYRAAWGWFLENALRQDTLTPELRAQLKEALRRCPRGSDQILDNIGRQPLYRASRERLQGKRPGLARLPLNWRERLIAAAGNTGLGAALCLLGLTGLRPSELERGVVLVRGAQELGLAIAGSKVHGDRGQPWRMLVLEGAHPWAGELMNRLSLEDSAPAGFRYPKALLQRQLRLLAERCFPDVARQHLPSALSFRHQFSSDLKRSGVALSVIAASLGHRSERTSQVYGLKSQGRAGGHGLIQARAGAPIRPEVRRSHIVSVTSRLLPEAQLDPIPHPAIHSILHPIPGAAGSRLTPRGF